MLSLGDWSNKRPRSNAGGIYVLTPYGSGDRSRAPFKVGMALSFTHRLQNYLTYMPFGFKLLMFLQMDNAQEIRETQFDEHGECCECVKGEKDRLLRHFFNVIEKEVQSKLDRMECEGYEGVARRSCEWYTSSPQTMLQCVSAALCKYNGTILIDETKSAKVVARLRLIVFTKRNLDVVTKYNLSRKVYTDYSALSTDQGLGYTITLTTEKEIKTDKARRSVLIHNSSSTPSSPGIRPTKKTITSKATPKKLTFDIKRKRKR
jgi:hypothetical protein